MDQPQRILYLVIAIVMGMALVDTLLPWATTQVGAMNMIESLILGLCAFAWVRADAQARSIEPPPGSALLAALMIPIGVPVYLFRALGARRGAWSSLKALGFIFSVAVIYFGVSYAAALL
jgi:ABC-type transport system involved in cytochrome c biogenesis permease component